jgi:hypothetical protein
MKREKTEKKFKGKDKKQKFDNNQRIICAPPPAWENLLKK